MIDGQTDKKDCRLIAIVRWTDRYPVKKVLDKIR